MEAFEKPKRSNREKEPSELLDEKWFPRLEPLMLETFNYLDGSSEIRDEQKQKVYSW